MEQYLIIILQLGIIVFITAESLLYVREKYGQKGELILAATYTVAFVLCSYFILAPDLGRELNPGLLLVNNIITVTVAIAILLLFNKMFLKYKNVYARYLFETFLAFVVASLYPIITIYVSCMTRLDCL